MQGQTRQAVVHISINRSMLRAGAIALIKSGRLWQDSLTETEWEACAAAVEDILRSSLAAGGFSPRIDLDRSQADGTA
jgi:hypothetical protein